MNIRRIMPLAKLNNELEEFAKTIPKLETVKEVRAERLIREKALQKRQDKIYQALFKKLWECEPRYPCFSAACPECFRRHRLIMIWEVMKLCKKRKKWRGLTLIFYQDAINGDELLEWRPDTLKARLRRWLKESGFEGMIIGGFEMDFHMDIQKWMPHFHLIIPNDKEAIKKLRIKMKNKRNMNTREGVVNRPMLSSKLKVPKRQISYRFKAIWWRVESIQHNDIYLLDNKERKRRRWTRKYRLLSKQHTDSLIMLDTIGMAGLTFMYKVRRYGDHLLMS
ncbi:hypothetical protein H8I69_23205 [Serratia fonticola]|uniref:hypothetical protein n=1 Tax=Serratia fonticola TaxID=47917 RepID=UPI0015C64972|nr:hypothetical protein [Serratia fonticola]MBC3382027.1 hypothetical protein [Serratia fonticola]NYA41226.1 hypothetical protein [Serratia fonticola]